MNINTFLMNLESCLLFFFIIQFRNNLCPAFNSENKFKNISIQKYILPMKQHHLNPQDLLLHSPLSEKHSHSNLVEVHTEYNLCHSFMRITGDQLVTKELQMMIQSKKLIDSLIEKSNVGNVQCFPSKHRIEQSLNSGIKEQQSSILQQNDGNISIQGRSKRIISRKNNNGSGIKGSNFCESLQDVKQNCSRNTFNQIQTLFQNYQKLDQKMRQLENKQNLKQIKRSPTTFASNNEYFEQIVTLTTRNNKLEHQLKLLKQKADSIPTSTTQTSPPIHQYYQGKHQLLIQKQDQINSLSQKIHRILEAQLIEKGCEKCCGMMKKVKDSLVKYRNCLQDQLVQQDQIFKSYEASIASFNNKQ